MAEALIGYTGVIGSNLVGQHGWDSCFNSRNHHELDRAYDTVVCCAAPGIKHKANLDPGTDLTKIASLIGFLDTIAYRPPYKFILISTADVFGQPVSCGEDDDPDPDCAYGRHRLLLEETVKEFFENWHIVRLPGIVAPNLKKNAIYDLRNEHRLEYLNPESVYQWYDLSNLWADLRKVTHPITHFCPKPQRLSDTVRLYFPHLEGRLGGKDKPVYYNLRTKWEER